MKPTCKILIGGVVRNEEASFLRRVVDDFASVDLLVLANFLVGGHQIDFVVVTPQFAALLELKNYTRPISGEKNGSWTVRDVVGNDIPTSNSYQQALEEAFALSDEMRKYRRFRTVVPPPQKHSYYSNFRTFVCVYPTLPPGSQVTRGDHRISVAPYPAILEKIRSSTFDSSWTMADWERFAVDQLRLSPVNLAAASDEKSLEAQNVLSAYLSRVQKTISLNLGPMINANDEAIYGDRLVSELAGSSNYLLFGPSGSAKTFHLQHLALKLIETSAEVPLLLDSKRYRGGDFWSFLRQSISPFVVGDPKGLLNAIAQSEKRATVLLDALNECDVKYRDDLLRGIQAFAINYDSRIVVTGHERAILLGGITVVPIQLDLPDAAQRRSIYAHYAGLIVADNLDSFCSGFTNAYDISLAGKCHKSGNLPRTRVELYERYIDFRLPPTHRVVASALLRHLADQLGQDLEVVMSREKCEILAENFLSQNDASLGILDSLFESGLVQVTADSFSFEHELLLVYFRADQLRRRALGGSALALELERPINVDLLPFVLPRIADKERVVAVIGAAFDLRTLVDIAEGGCGEFAKSVLTTECSKFISEAISALRFLAVNIVSMESNDGKRQITSVDVEESTNWTKRQKLLCMLLAEMVGTSLQDQIVHLIELSERALNSAVQAAAGRGNVSFRRAWSEVIHQYGGIVVRHEMILPISTLLSAIRSGTMSRSANARIGSEEGRVAFYAQLRKRVEAAPNEIFPYLILMESFGRLAETDSIIVDLEVIDKALKIDVGTVRLAALNHLRNMYRRVERGGEQALERVRHILEKGDFKNSWLQAEVVELLSYYNLIESPVSVETATSQFLAIAEPSAEESRSMDETAKISGETPLRYRRHLAYQYVASIFEDVFQNAYYDAYCGLTIPQKRAVLSLAAEQESFSFHRDWILRELVEWRAPEVLPTFKNVAAVIDHESSFLQTTVSAFVSAIEGCAYYLDSPPMYVGNGSVFDDGWRVISAEIFWSFKEADGSVRPHSSDSVWDSLRGETRLAAGIALHELERCGRGSGLPRSAQVDLGGRCPHAMLGVAQYCLENRTGLVEFKRYVRDSSLIFFWIGVLGSFGNSFSLLILRSFVDNSLYGRTALAAIRSIQEREIGSQLGR